MACIVKKKHHLKVLFKEMQFVAFFIFHMGKTRMQVKNDLRCLRQTRSYNCEELALHISLANSLCVFHEGSLHLWLTGLFKEREVCI